jgi:hypothetical protein
VVAYTCYAIPTVPSWWPAKQQGATLDYSLDISSAVNPDIDFVLSVSAAIAPSGAGEMALSDIIVFENVITLTCSGGVQSRVYTIMLTVTMTDGRIFDFLVYQAVPPGLRGYAVPVAPSPGFSDPQVWNYAPMLDFTNPLNSAYAPWMGGVAP